MRVIHPLKMDLVCPWTGDLLHMVQGDSNTRVVELQLFSDGKEWDIPPADLVTVAFKKPDQTKGFYETNGTTDGNRIQVVLAPQVLTAHGKVTVVVGLHRSNGESLASFPFGIMVAQNPEVDAEASEDYFNYVNPFITEALKEANLAAAEAYAAAEKANSSSEVAYRAERKVDALREVVSKFHSNIIETATGEFITVSDASDLPLAGLKIFGKTVQDGTPTPDAPVALESVGDDGSVGMSVSNKNMLKFPYYELSRGGNNYISAGGVTFITNDDGSITFSGTNTGSTGTSAEYLFTFNTGENRLWLPIGTYTVSTGVEPFTESKWYLMVGTYSGTIDGTSKSVRGGSAQFTVTEPGYAFIVLRLNSGKTADNVTVYPQIEIGSVATKYEKPIAHQTAVIPTPNGLPGIPVASGGNYTDSTGQQWICDEVDFVRGQYIQRIYCYTFTGQETINSFDSGKTLGRNIKLLGLPSCIVQKKGSESNVSPMLCTHEAVTTQEALKNGSGGIAVAVWDNNQFVYFSGTYYGSIDGLKTAMAEAYASGNPYVWMYALETPIPRELTEAEKAGYTALHTNYPNTTVYNDGSAGMEVKYVADTKLYIDKKFAELATALVNNV